MKRRAMSAAAFALLVGAGPAGAQSWRTLTAERGVSKEDSLRVVVRYGLGKLTLRAAPPAVLYDLSMRYDAETFRAESHYDARTHTLSVGADSSTAERFSLQPRNFHGSGEGRNRAGQMTLALARGIPLDLSIGIGIGQASIDFGDLWVGRARIETAMGETNIDFPTPNVHPMKELVIEAALGGLGVHHLGNARAERVRVAASLGGGMIDLRGTWSGEMTVDVSTSLGGFTVRVPSDAGVRITASTTLAGIDAKGFVLRNGTYYSANYASAARKVTITGSTTLGGLEINWIDP